MQVEALAVGLLIGLGLGAGTFAGRVGEGMGTFPLPAFQCAPKHAPSRLRWRDASLASMVQIMPDFIGFLKVLRDVLRHPGKEFWRAGGIPKFGSTAGKEKTIQLLNFSDTPKYAPNFCSGFLSPPRRGDLLRLRTLASKHAKSSRPSDALGGDTML
jgi:hypothetical protein